jgi:hypothetical protein
MWCVCVCVCVVMSPNLTSSTSLVFVIVDVMSSFLVMRFDGICHHIIIGLLL